MRSALGLKISAITAGIKKFKSIINKKKKQNTIILLAKNKLNITEVLISKALINSCISHDAFVLVNNVSRENDFMKEVIKNLKTLTVHQRF